MSFESCDSSLLLALPDDVSAIISQSLSPKDICNISLCCRSPGFLVVSEKVWLTQCEMLEVVPLKELLEWRKGVSSYKILCRFLVSVKRLLGTWVNQNPELGNLVYVLPGFLSVVGCRILPQKANMLETEEGCLQWTPVFEVIGDFDGSATFFLHGRDAGCDYLHPGLVKSFDKNCNVLLLEVDTTGLKKGFKSDDPGDLIKFSSCLEETESDEESEWILGSDETSIPFSQLDLNDRKGLIRGVTTQLRFTVPDGPLFPGLPGDIDRDMVLLSDRRAVLLQKHKLGSFLIDREPDSEVEPNPFSSGDTLRLTFHASVEELSYYRTWPMMFDKRFSLYKFPSGIQREDHQGYAGLWGGTYGWPAQNSSEKPLFLVVISYEDSNDGRHIIATKILEGTRIACRPNGSVMFHVNIDNPSKYRRLQAMDQFPWDVGADSLPVIVEDAFKGEGIASGYGFRYPGSKPGSLYVIHEGVLAFVWKDSLDVLTLKRLDLQQRLRNGKRLKALPPVGNFSYMYRTSGNVYADS